MSPTTQDNMPQDQEAPEGAAQVESDEEQPLGETSAEGDTSEAVEPGDGAEEVQAETEAVEPLDAPTYWSREAKERFGNLPRELQEVVLAQEGPREAATAKAKAEAAADRQQAQSQMQGVQTLAEQLSSFLPEAIQTFQQRWGEPDWEATIEQYGSEQAAKLRARYDREQAQLQQVAQAHQVATTQAQQAFVQAEWAKLAELNPALAPDVKDPRQGSEKRQEVTKYLLGQGIGRDAVQQISASEMTIAHKAMLWDQAQAAAKAKPAPTKPVPRAPSSAARPAAAAAGSPQQRSAQGVQNSFNAKPTLDNAVALLMSRSKR